jgi:hypothetical protein
MPIWIVQGFITKSKGIDMKWANATKSTTKEKAHKGKVKVNGRLGVVKREQKINILNSNGGMIPRGEVRVSQLAP